MSQNIIFVDIDGPLLPGKLNLFEQNHKITRQNLDKAEPMFDPFAVKVFNLWARYGNAKIVFSTNWATQHKMTIDILKEIMRLNGLSFDYHHEILTPKKFTSERGSEIWWWILDNMKDGDRFIAVDDDQSCEYIQKYIGHNNKDNPKVEGGWINVDFQNGISWENFMDGLEFLDIPKSAIDEGEFGIKPLTAEEKIKYEKSFDLYYGAMI